MRVVTGTARGLRLETLEGMDTRPTAQRVKEAMFSAIQFDIDGRRVLDLFAGSGQLGIEALSRGASGCVFVDRNSACAEIVRRNLKAAGLTANTQVLTQDAMSYLTRPGDTFDLVFLDPPYAAGLLEAALTQAAAYVNPGGLILCESDAGQSLPERAGACRLAKTYRYGRVHVWLYRWEDEGRV